MQKKLHLVLKHINITKPICNSIVGKQHTFSHRALAGISIMLCGVLIAKYAGASETVPLEVAGDAIGYSLHGIGLIPFIEAILKTAAEEL